MNGMSHLRLQRVGKVTYYQGWLPLIWGGRFYL
jgi:hypothetical protein